MRLHRIAAVAAAGLLCVAACGGGGDGAGASGGGGSAATPTVDPNAFRPGATTGWSDGGVTVDAAGLRCADAPTDPARGLTATEIRVGGLASLTAPGGAALAGAELGAEVRFKRANDSGGVHGRKINYLGTKDDGTDPGRSVQLAQSIAERDQVFAVVPAISAFPNFLDPLCQAGIPFFGWGTNTAMCENALGFAFTGCLLQTDDKSVPSSTGMLTNTVLGGDLAGKTAAVLGSDNDSARQGVEVFKRTLGLAGLKVTYAEAAAPTSGVNDATPIVNAIMTSNKGAPPEIMILSLSFPATLKITEALRAAGFTGEIVNQVGYDPRLANFASFKDSLTYLQWAPLESAASSPALDQLKKDFAEYAPDQTISLTAMAGYWSADFFLAAVEKAGPDLTAASLLELLNGGGYTYEVPGAVAESRWPLNHNVPTPCGSAVRLADGRFEVVQPLACGATIPTRG
ncbi:ABC transporter substrate-binding protein [Frankia sp. CNm7]|uniref:ABC transporter substrate-binding protein n=1 Tax=Frankia nepalensis TaxID=1836974 RepID=A0A937RBN1_9ACTN|nr:ABC transporter substrate-binding protein [Frankia nepalensis]MBL7496393.1 ABC transporter substrate-binding protein [Frankia nepalensis]MBL7511457.1 ABC transporter substrate-binding protein [Frankia nepalensis]MBL7523863.1 ABC transporter substrate-binding protein [Frankia nepalensis]MBL7627322.1 ABC transporter substrate-binding protein [Frankia nepalensis]